ncbi:MAG: hypothetical protein KAI66_15465 [Lentisphaeria bacterium]|nr:hypothetical protein [Lentisphaeria bacterium]
MNDRNQAKGTTTLKWAVAGLIVVAVMFFVSAVVFGFPPDTGGISSLNRHTGWRLTDREVYQRHYGNMMDEAVMYRFTASPAEIQTIVQSSGMHEVSDASGGVDWPPVRRLLYWWRPPDRGKGKVFRSPKDGNRTRVLHYEQGMHLAYFVYFET